MRRCRVACFALLTRRGRRVSSLERDRSRLFELLLGRVRQVRPAGSERRVGACDERRCDIQLPRYGRAGAEFQLLLAFVLRQRANAANGGDEGAACAALLDTLRDVNRRVAQHPNASLYRALASVLELGGYFLESEPCRVCSEARPRRLNLASRLLSHTHTTSQLTAPFASTSLSELTAENKFTSSTHIVRLKRRIDFNSVAVTLSQVRRTRYVKCINIFYNTKQASAALCVCIESGFLSVW